MISRIKIKKEKDSVIYKCWGTKEFKFTDGINIIFGPNGCGKSVLLDTIGHYVGIDERGWSTGLTPYRTKLKFSYKNKEKETYNSAIEENSKLGHIEIDWDGIAVYKADTQRDSNSMLQNLMGGGSTEEVSLGEALSLKMSNLSSGQNATYFAGRIMEMQVPDLTKPVHENSNSTWQKKGRLLSDYVKKLKRDGKPTLLLDEPDKSLDYISQQFFWDKVVDAYAKKYQVIVITHSPFALNRTNDNIIDKNNYFKKSKELITKAFKGK